QSIDTRHASTQSLTRRYPLQSSPILHSTNPSTPILPLESTQDSKMTPQLPHGVVINNCTIPNTIAIAFDDGPYIYTEQVLDILANASIHATFFLNGDWKGNIDELSHIVQRTFAEGHQIGSHSWSHLNLTTLPYKSILTEMTTLESAFLRILGFIPTYTRTPWLHVNELMLSVMADLRYHVIGASIVTDDKVYDSPERSWKSFELFVDGLDGGGSIVLAHDSQENTAAKLVGRMIKEVESRGLNAVTVGECLGHPSEFWYRSG
ncbi:peptidoglycan-N-acetylglucosamine deacetylase, partial [Penicillium subrubescens]|uniref:peptidoglycan-N-acetylglucosamine deacetylase n=1 Tax=Penicillium subrubescens TaxID=1316194 RepID=UPI002545B659